MRSARVARRARPEGLALALTAALDSLVRHHTPTATTLAAGASSTPVSKRCAATGQEWMGGIVTTRRDLRPRKLPVLPRIGRVCVGMQAFVVPIVGSFF